MDKELKKVIDHLFEEGAKIKTTPPMEVVRLFKYQIVPSNQGGLWDQAFTTMVFAEGDLRQLNAYQLFMLCRISKDDTFSVAQLKRVFKEMVPLSAEFLGTCGLESVWTNCKLCMSVMDKVETQADFNELMESYCSFITNLHNWVHFYFPWYAGEIFKMRKKADVAEMAQMMGV